MTEKGRNRAEIVYEDNSSNCPLLVVIHSISVSADWFSATGKALSSANRLLLEVPEYTTFKDGEVLSNKDGSYIFILNIHGKYLTSFYASLNQKGVLKIEDGLSAWENQIEKYRFATESERRKLVDALKASKEPEAKEYLKRFFGIEEKLKYDFKPFDKGVQHGDWVRCVLCGAQMLLPCGADKCPECSSKDTLMWVDENRQEMDAKHLDCLVPIRKLELQEYLSPEILKMEHIRK